MQPSSYRTRLIHLYGIRIFLYYICYFCRKSLKRWKLRDSLMALLGQLMCHSMGHTHINKNPVNMCLREKDIIVFSWSCIQDLMLIYELFLRTWWCSMYYGADVVRQTFSNPLARFYHSHICIQQLTKVNGIIRKGMRIGLTSEMMIDWIFDGGAKAIQTTVVYTQFGLASAHFQFFFDVKST